MGLRMTDLERALEMFHKSVIPHNMKFDEELEAWNIEFLADPVLVHGGKRIKVCLNLPITPDGYCYVKIWFNSDGESIGRGVW